MKLKHIKHQQIDFEKWDNTIAKSQAPIFYNSSWFLNVVSPNWEALVSDDYSIIFPLTVRTVFGIKVLIQPQFCQQLRLLSNRYSNNERYNNVKKRLPFAPVLLQTNTMFKGFNNVSKQFNLILNLGSSFEDIEKNFNSNTKRNIKKSQSYNLRIESFFDSDFYIKFGKENSPYEYSSSHFVVLQKIIEKSIEKNYGELKKVVDENGNILSVGFFISQYGRKTFLSGFSSPSGFEKRSMFFLINHSIKESIGVVNVFDFEGSKVEGIARFYRGFGAEEECYYSIENKFLKSAFNIFKKIKK